MRYFTSHYWLIAITITTGVAFSFSANAQCPTAPSGLSSTALTTTSAQVSFTGGSGTTWEIQYGPVGFNLVGGTTQTTSSTTTTINSLTSNLLYDFYVRGVCGGTNSTWTGPVTMESVITNCDNFDIYTAGHAASQSSFIDDWFGSPEDSEFSTDYANSTPMSLKIHDSGINGASDAVADMGVYNSGIHILKTDILIPTGNYGGYYNIQHNYTPTLGDWSIEVTIDNTGLASVVSNAPTSYNFGTYNINMGVWNTVEHIIDLDNDTAFILVNGNFTDVGWKFSLTSSTGSGGQFNSFDFYSSAPTGQTPLAYFDNFCVTDAPINDVGISTLITGVPPICGDTSYYIGVVVENHAYNNQSNFPINIAATGLINTTISTAYPGTLQPGVIDTLYFGPYNTISGGNLNLAASTNLTGDTDPLNDGVIQSNITYLAGVSVELGPGDTSYCSNVNFNMALDATNPSASYLWTDNTTTATRAVTTPGTYGVTVTHTNGCTATDQIIVTEIASPTVDLGDDLSDCAGESISFFLNAQNAGQNVLWSTGQTTQAILVTEFGEYGVTVTNSLGCPDSDVVEIVALPLPVIPFEDVSGCADDTIILDAGNPGSTYIWSVANQTTQTYQVSQGGPYRVTVIDANGCKNSDTAVVTINPYPFVILGPDQNINEGSSVTLDAGNSGSGSTYLWSNGEVAQTIVVSEQGTYSVTVTNSFGCTNSDDVVVNVFVGINELTGKTIQIFPNPVNDLVSVKTDFSAAGNVQLRLYSMNGQLVGTTQHIVSGGEQTIEHDMSELSSGLYLLHVSMNNETIGSFTVSKQ